MHICVAGNIGAGKTTLTYLLAKYFGFETLFEDNEQNPYLMDFYSDMQRWSFNLQVSFLQSRLKKTDPDSFPEKKCYSGPYHI